MSDTPQAEAGSAVAVGAVAVDPAGRVLIVRRGRPPCAGEWSLPGGRVETGESLEDAIVREVREETAIDVRVVAPLGVVDIVRGGFRYSIHEYLVAVTSRAPHPMAGDDAADARWAGRGDLDALGVRADAIAVVDRAIALLTRDADRGP